jgi:TusA-related sulfurtransferase
VQRSCLWLQQGWFRLVRVGCQEDVLLTAYASRVFQEVVMTDDVKANRTVDLKGQVCPYTFVRSKLAIEKMGLGEVLEIVLDHKPAVENVPKSMENEGQKVLKIDQTGEKEWHVFIRKDKEKKRS